MFRPVCIFFLWLFLFQSGPVLAGDQLSEILNGIRERYGNLPGLTVTYDREIITRSMALLGDQMKTDLATGRINFKPPYYLMIQQETPKPETVTTDGDTLWWYIPQKGLVYRYPSNRLGKELRLLSDIFRGLSEVGDSFDVMQSTLDVKQGYRLKLIPNPPWQEIDHINLSVARDNFSIRVVEIHNYLGGITRFTFGDFSMKDGFTDRFFRFVVPDGVRVIEENG
ncbi:MAG: outer membrane lipoprotein carrier protein LolA [Deltaproteobacteria bacterium]|nr:outer membrane lipoprotein carrier protein LolA [Deltaproteobacteria bacterium]